MLILLMAYAVLWTTVASQSLISRGKPTSASSVLHGTTGSIAVDGRYEAFMLTPSTGTKIFTNCFHSNTEANPFLVVDLLGQFKIDHVILYNRVDCCSERIVGSVVELLSATGELIDPCGKVTSAKAISHIPCGNKLASKIRVKGAPNQYLQICELDVFGDLASEQQIVSRGKPTAESSKQFEVDSSVAVDGRYENFIHQATTGDKFNKNCFHTKNDPNPFWSVDLLGQFRISHVVLYNRVDCCSERIKGAVVELLSATGTVTHECGKITEVKNIYNISCGDKEAHKVRVKGAANQYLHLCEIDVVGHVSAPALSILSREKPLSQSSEGYNLSSSLAVDGKYEAVMQTDKNDPKVHKNCFVSNNEAKPYLTVFLQENYLIDHVVLYNRVDCCSERIVGAVVELLSTCGNVIHECGKITDSKDIYHLSCGNKEAASVQVRGAANQFLQICEIDVIGG